MLTLLAVAFGSRRAYCEPKLVVDLDYRTDAALEGCPGDAAFRSQIQSQLGYDPFRTDSAQKVVARAAADRDGIKGLVRWYDATGTPRGERELTSPSKSCPAFARAMSFAIAVQIQLLNEEAKKPAAPASKPSPETEPGAEALAKGQSESPATDARTSEVRANPPPLGPGAPSPSAQPSPWLVMVGAGPSVRFGVSPGAAAEGRIFAAVRRNRLALEVGADASLPSRNSTAEGEGFEQTLAGGSLAVCAFLQPFSGCLVNRWARLGVRGFGVETPHSPSGLVAQLGPRIALNGSFARGWIGALRFEALLALSPWRVTLRDQEVWRAPVLSLSVGVDLAAIFNDNP